MLNSLFNSLSSTIEFLNSPVNMTTDTCTQINSRLLPTLRYCSTETVQIATEGQILLIGAAIGLCSGVLITNAYQALRNRLRGTPEIKVPSVPEKAEPLPDQTEEPSREQVADHEKAAQLALVQNDQDKEVFAQGPKQSQEQIAPVQELPVKQAQAPKEPQKQVAPAQRESLFTCMRGLSRLSSVR